jgi:uncharacterized protein (DUF58 family)
LDITATTATPLAVLTGFALNCGNKLFLCSSGTADMISVSLTVPSTPYFFAALFFALFKFSVWFVFTASTICSMTSFTVRNLASSCEYTIRLCFPREEVTIAPTFIAPSSFALFSSNPFSLRIILSPNTTPRPSSFSSGKRVGVGAGGFPVTRFTASLREQQEQPNQDAAKSRERCSKDKALFLPLPPPLEVFAQKALPSAFFRES